MKPRLPSAGFFSNPCSCGHLPPNSGAFYQILHRVGALILARSIYFYGKWPNKDGKVNVYGRPALRVARSTIMRLQRSMEAIDWVRVSRYRARRVRRCGASGRMHVLPDD